MTQQGGGRQSVARARITIDTSQFQRAGELVIRTSQRMAEGVQRATTQFQRIGAQGGSALRQLSIGFQEIERRQRAFANSDFGRVTQGLREAEQAMRGYSLAAGAAVAYGIAQAQNMNRNNVLLRVFAGSQERATALQKELRDIAKETGQAYATLLESAVAILPATNRYNIDLEQTLSLMQRLALLDPFQGMQGASFAIREALSGDAISLAKRFEELSLNQVNSIIDRAAGDPSKVIAGLDELVSSIGLTHEQFVELNQTGINAFERLQGAVNEAFGTAFMPALNNVVIPFVENITTLTTKLTETNPEILQFAATGAIIIAGFSPVLLLFNQITQSLVTMRAASAAAGGMGGLRGIAGRVTGSTLGRVALRGAAAYGGMELGVAGSRLLAQAGLSNDPRLANASQEEARAILGERIKQIALVLVKGILDLVQIVRLGASHVENVLDILATIIRIGAYTVGEGFGEVVAGLGSFLVAIDSLLYRLGDTSGNVGRAGNELLASGLNLSSTSRANREMEETHLADLFSGVLLRARQNQINTESETSERDILTSLNNILFPAVETASEEIEESGEEIAESTNWLADILNNGADQLRDAIAEMNQINADAALRDSRLNEDRGIQDSRQNFDDALSRARQLRDFQQSMQESESDFLAGRQRAQADFNAQQAEEDAQAYEDRLEQLTEFNLETKRRNEDFGRELVKIQRDTNEAVRTAALRLDASGVSEAYRRGEQRTNEITEQFQIESERRDEDFRMQMETLTANLETQRSQRLIAFQQQQSDEWAQYNQQRQRQITAFQQRLADEDFDRVIRRQREIQDRQLADSREMQDRQRRIAGLAVQVGQEIGLWNALQSNVGNALTNIRNGIASIFAINTAKATTNSVGGAISRGITRAIPTFAQGTSSVPTHRPVIVGERGPELAYFTHPARIYSAESSVTRNYMSNGGGGGSLLNIESFAPYFGARGVDDMMPELMRFLNAALEQFWQEYAARKGGV